MGSPNPFEKTEKSSGDNSLKFEVPFFSDFNKTQAPISREASQESSHLWMNDYLKPATSISDSRLDNLNTQAPIIRNLPNVFENLWGGMRDQSVDIKNIGTGHHDDRLIKDRHGQFREPSLRRGFGFLYQTPRALGDIPAGQINEYQRHTAQTMEPIAETQPSTSAPQTCSSGSQRPQPSGNNKTNNPYDLVKAKFRRGDLQTGASVQIALRPSKAKGQPNTKQPKIMINLDHCEEAEKETVGAKVQYSKTKKKEKKAKWKLIRGCVETWCESRRLRETRDGRANSDSELDALLDEWHKLHATKFCADNRDLLEIAGWTQADGQNANNSPDASDPPQSTPQSEQVAAGLDFEGTIWPAVQEKFMEFAEAKILSWNESKLRERIQALESLTRPPLLKANSSPESYQTYVEYLRNRIEAAGKNSTAIRNTEAVMSMALDLLPGLEEQLREQLDRVLNKEEARPDVDTNQGWASDNARSEGGNDAEESHDESKEDDDLESFDEVYAEYSKDLTYRDPGETPQHYTGGIMESIEPRTPIVTPRSMAQLRYYEKKYIEARRAAKAQEEAEMDGLRSVDGSERDLARRKRKAPDIDEFPLVIRSKLRVQRLAAPATPTPPAKKKQRLDERQYSPTSTASSSSELPTATTTAAATASKPGEIAGPSPCLFVTPDPAARRTNTPLIFRKRSSRHIEPEERSERFREETAEFLAMTPSAREVMLYNALREMRQRQG
ncbi:hypothetical protein FBEOM_2905 [Fusarium beomiforme]|uniref:Uncharacterized protein n=1 Tax=Fusarium beomiforme TaxID=44412 RepID=A0A9P5DZN6_9HYPO|nr:hypothetical protein FBEOM_2905 [Fusarium beomiforme]